MDQGTLVIEEAEKDAGRDLIDRISETRPVKLAFWLKPAESGKWFLYIAAEGIDDSNVDRGYKEVLRRVKEMRTPYFDPFQVKLIQGDNPLARAVMEVHQRYPGSLAINYKGSYLGGMSIEGAYLYPLPNTSPVN
ncbi:MAG: hypothetical protein ACHRXM_29760 [Isosphaerales bacterium]